MFTPIVVMPDAERVAVTALRAFLGDRAEPYAQGVTVCTSLTAGVTPSRVVRVRRKGGGTLNKVADRARLDVLVWHDTDADRMALGQLIRGFYVSLTGVFAGVNCYGGTEFMTPQQMPDPDDDTRELVMLTVDVVMRGSQLS